MNPEKTKKALLLIEAYNSLIDQQVTELKKKKPSDEFLDGFVRGQIIGFNFAKSLLDEINESLKI